MTNEALKKAALDYHRMAPVGKLEIKCTKALETHSDLALAYSPGVAAACQAIVENQEEINNLTARRNLVAVITNGTAVLGLGNIGPYAAKPVMEGKAVLFKKFSGIDSFDIEINETDPDKFVDIVASLEPTFGGINLEDIKAPECFTIEKKLRERMKIPVMHDDQHGTAIIVSAAIKNALRLVNKKLADVKLVCSGAGAAALACLDLLVDIGLPLDNIWVSDLAGVVYKGRKELMDPRKDRYARETEARTLDDIIADADIFLGLSAGGVLKPAMVKKMAAKPIIMALANPTPEILPVEVRAARDDAIVATGRSDYPNQVNNALCFPYLFRGALDVGATVINEAMKIACVDALANLAMQEASDVVTKAYSGQNISFGVNYIIPKPFDPRLILELAPAVARAAMQTGVATRPIADFDVYRTQLEDYVFRSASVMRPIFMRAKASPKRVVYAEGEEMRVLHAVQSVVDEGIAKPVLIGRPEVILSRLNRLSLRLRPAIDFELVNPEADERYDAYWELYHQLLQRRGVTPSIARRIVRTNPTVIAGLMVRRGEVDAMICGTTGRFQNHFRDVLDVIGKASGVAYATAISAVVMPKGTYFFADSHVLVDPSADQIVETTLLAAEKVRHFGITPKVALVSHSNFGSSDAPVARKMRMALDMLRRLDTQLEVEGEMHANIALDESLRRTIFPNTVLEGSANLFIMPTLDAAHVAFSLLQSLGDGMPIGPMTLGLAHPAHVLTTSTTVRGILNMTAMAVVDAQEKCSERAMKR